MRFISIAKLPREPVGEEWALTPNLMLNEETEEESWSVFLTHRHNVDGIGLKWFGCHLVEDAGRHFALRPSLFSEIDWECSACEQIVPKNIAQAKRNRQRSLRGTDPRNDRRGAVLATREKHERCLRH